MEDPNRQHPLAPFWVQHGPDNLAYLPWKGWSCNGVDTQWVEPAEVHKYSETYQHRGYDGSQTDQPRIWWNSGVRPIISRDADRVGAIRRALATQKTTVRERSDSEKLCFSWCHLKRQKQTMKTELLTKSGHAVWTKHRSFKQTYRLNPI